MTPARTFAAGALTVVSATDGVVFYRVVEP
jgi:hypothetical protein